jgi:outer membrane protein W
MLRQKYIGKLPATLCLALTLTSVFAHAEDNALINEANAALSQKDYSGAFSKFSVLAQHGNATAQFNLGAFYLNGQGVQKDEKQAFEWFAKSAAQKNARALQVIQNAAAKGNENAKNVSEKFAPPKVATPSSATDVKAKGSVSTAATNAGLAQSSVSSPSAFSVGLNLGQTGKLSGINNSTSFGLSAGYKFNPNFSAELAYNMLYRNANADSLASATIPGRIGTFDLTALSLVGQYTYALSSNWCLLENLGFHSSSNKLNSSGNSSRSGSSYGLVVGLKLQYDVSKSIGIRGGFDTYTESGAMTGMLTEVGLGVIYKF